MANVTTPDSSGSAPSTSGYHTSGPAEDKRLGFAKDQVIAGRYILLEMLGQGGMGEVWAARQEEPVKRKVAIKLIRGGGDSRSFVNRFEQERQALALMDHPNIAKVYDGGILDEPRGQHFFVMELVQGQALIKFCDQHKLSVHERLTLFIPICRAIQHAHQKGIIHRDIKPANILVAMVDDKPMPKVIDFGVAKAVTGKLTEETLSTQLGAMVGTLEYMPPEQAGLSLGDVDTRADIYALGVVLFELLTGLRPFDSKRLRRAAFDEMLRIIKEEEPPSLASRLSTDESLASLAAVRQCEPSRLMTQLKGELDWIVKKCLEKNRERRYDTANGLARDVERYLANEPLEARPVTAAYRLAKLYSRHRGVFWGTGLVALALVAGTVAALWGMRQAQTAENEARVQAEIAGQERAKAVKEKDEKEAARAAEARQREIAEKNEKRAQLEADRTKAVSRFLQNDLLALSSVEAQYELEAGPLGRDVKVRELLDRASTQVEFKFKDQPELEAEIRMTIGATYRRLGELKRSIPHLERALELCRQTQGEDEESTVSAMNSLAVAYHQDDQYAKSAALHDAIASICKKHPEWSATHRLRYDNNRAVAYFNVNREEEGLQLLRNVVDNYRKLEGPASHNAITAACSYGYTLVRMGRAKQAEQVLREAYESSSTHLGKEHPDTLVSIINLCQCYEQLGKSKQAYQLLSPLIEIMERVMGPTHPRTLTAISTLAKSLEDLNRNEEAEKLFRKVWQLEVAELGPNAIKTLKTENNLAVVLGNLNRLDEAAKMLEHVYEQRRQQLGEENTETLITLNNWAGVLSQQKQFDRAVSFYQICYEKHRKSKGATHHYTLRMLSNLANCYYDQQKFAEAYTRYEEVRRLRLQTLGPTHPDTLYAGHFLAETHRQLKQPAQAVALYKEILPLFKEHLGSDHADTVITANNYAVVLSQVQQYPESIKQFLWVIEQRTRLLGANHAETLRARTSLISVYRNAGMDQEVIQEIQGVLPQIEKSRGKNHASVYRLMNDMGVSHYKLKQYDAAVTVYTELLARKKTHLGESHAETLDTQTNLGNNLYSAGKVAQGIDMLEKAYSMGQTKIENDFARKSLIHIYRLQKTTEKLAVIYQDDVATSRKKHGPNDARTAAACDTLADCLQSLNRWKQAEEAWRECLGIQEKLGQEAAVAITRIKIGTACLQQKKTQEAEPLLVQGCQALRKYLDAPGVTDLQRKAYHDGVLVLVRWYEETGKPAEAQRWKKELETVKK